MMRQYLKDIPFWVKIICFFKGHRWCYGEFVKDAGEMHSCLRCTETHFAGRVNCYGNCPGTEECDCGAC